MLLSILDTLGTFEPLFTALATIGGLTSLIILIREVRLNTNATKGSTYQDMISSIAQWETSIFSNKDVAEIYRKGFIGSQLNEIEEIRFNELCSSWFNFFENFHYQKRKKLIDEEVWSGWKNTFIDSLSNPGVKKWWDKKEDLFSKSFRNMVSTELGIKGDSKKASEG